MTVIGPPQDDNTGPARWLLSPMRQLDCHLRDTPGPLPNQGQPMIGRHSLALGAGEGSGVGVGRGFGRGVGDGVGVGEGVGDGVGDGVGEGVADGVGVGEGVGEGVGDGVGVGAGVGEGRSVAVGRVVTVGRGVAVGPSADVGSGRTGGLPVGFDTAGSPGEAPSVGPTGSAGTTGATEPLAAGSGDSCATDVDGLGMISSETPGAPLERGLPPPPGTDSGHNVARTISAAIRPMTAPTVSWRRVSSSSTRRP